MATVTTITLSSDNGDAHRPAIYPEYKYDILTQTASVSWTAAGGWFRYSYLQFGVQMRRKVNGEWKYTTTLIGGMLGGNNANIWATSGYAEKQVLYGSNTQIRFVVRCSSSAEDGYCDAGWGSTWTADTGWSNLLTETKNVKLTLKEGTAHLREYDNHQYSIVSKYVTKIYVHWELSDLGCTRLVASIYDNNGNLVASPYTVKNPLTFSSATNSGNITFSDLTTVTKYTIKIGVANTDVGEKLDDDWEDECTTKSFYTREEQPYIYFTNGTSLGTSATVDFECKLNSTGKRRRLYSLAYTVHDDTTDKDVITDKYVFDEMTSDIAVTKGNAYGTFTITGLTAGHDYTVTPSVAVTTVHGVSMKKAFSTTINGAIAPEISTISNSGTDLIFGEPDGSPTINVKLTGTKDVWSITLKIGTSISSGIVTSPVVTLKNASIGTNKCSLSDTALDAIYKTISTKSKTTIYVSIEYKLASGGGSAGSSYKSATMTLKGNAKTSRVGISGTPHRSKVWIGVNGEVHRAVAWVGINGTPHRSL